MAILNWHRQPRLHEARNRSERFGPETTLGLQCGVREIQARIQESGFISLWDIGHTWQDQRIIEPVSRQVRGGSGLLPSSLTLEHEATPSKNVPFLDRFSPIFGIFD